jgi:phosphonate transport system substrate-binding protein
MRGKALAHRIGHRRRAARRRVEEHLHQRYTDADGDLIADIPTDPSQWVDPDTLIFAYTPVEDPAVYAEVWAGFLDHMSEVTGKKVQFFPVQSNAAQIEAMRAGRLHVAGFNTGSNPLAVACAGFRPFAMMAAADGSFGYEMEIITYPGSGIERSRTSRAAPGLHLRDLELRLQGALGAAEGRVRPGGRRDFTPAFSGKRTTTRSSASPTRTTTPPPSPTRSRPG